MMIQWNLPDYYFDKNDSDNKCFLCGNPRYESYKTITHYSFPFVFQRCRCGMIKQTPMPNENFFDWFFNSELFFSSKYTNESNIWGYYDFFKDESCRLKTSQLRFKILTPYLEKYLPDGRLMKIGPATGTFLYIAKKHGYTVYGCDVSSKFVDFAQINYGVKIDQGRFEKMDYPNNYYDIIVLFNVIENVPNLDEFIQSVHQKLKPGGLFIFNYVDMKNNIVASIQKNRYFIFRPPVCYILSKDVVEKLLKNYGFFQIQTLKDFRYMHMEKITTLLGLENYYSILKKLNLDRIEFPIYSYPSKIVLSKKM